MKKIIVTVTNDLTTDQRVDKICTTLVEENYEVLLIGRRLEGSVPLNRSYQTKRIQLLFNKGFLFYAEYNIRLFFFLLFSKKDILHSNDLDTLLPNFLVSRIQSKKLIYDSHELFSEVPELVHRPFVKKCWVKLENVILPKLKNSFTVCESIANYYNQKYTTNFKVVRNLPKLKNVAPSSFPFSVENKKIILYQGAVNIGRGLELMINTISFLPDCIFVIIGSGDIDERLEQQVADKKLENSVKFLGRISPEELYKLTPLADVGISLEEDLGLNYRFALPNKIFDYIQAEVPVMVSDLPEMKRIIHAYQVGEIVKKRDAKKIAYQIESMLKQDFSLALKKAKQTLIWENEKKEFITLLKNL